MQGLLEVGAGDAPVRQTSRYERYIQLLSRPRAAFGVAALAFVMSLPAIAVGLTADDFDLALAVTKDPLSAYAFQPRDASVRHAQLVAARDAGTIPLWSDLEFHQAFFRPLSSLSLALDFKLWPNAAWLMHLENSLLFALIVLVAASLYKALGLSTRVQGLATAFFAMQGAQSMTTGWISGRNTLLAALFGFLAIRLFVAARSGGGFRLLALSLLTFVAGLLGAELGVSAVAYVFAYALCLGDQPAVNPGAGARVLAPNAGIGTLLGALSGFALAIVAWLAFYRLGGYGVRNSGFYVDLSHDPGRFVIDLALAIPIYLASQLTFPFASTAGTAPFGTPIVAAVSLLILYLSRRLWLPWVREDPRARVLGAGSLLAIIPLGSSPPQDRLVFFVSLGVCGLLALLIDERLRDPRGRSQGRQKGALRLLRLHAIWAPLVYIPFLFGSNSMIAGGGAVLLERTLGDDPRPVLLVNPPSYLPAHFLAAAREWRGQSHPAIDVLYGGSAELELTRIGDQSLQLTVARGYFATRVERIERDPASRPLHEAEVIPGARMRTQVLEVKNGAPTRVRFDFSEPLSSMRVYAWQGRRLELLALPKLGEQTHIQPASAL
jgi:hypothetical protein